MGHLKRPQKFKQFLAICPYFFINFDNIYCYLNFKKSLIVCDPLRGLSDGICVHSPLFTHCL